MNWAPKLADDYFSTELKLQRSSSETLLYPVLAFWRVFSGGPLTTLVTLSLIATVFGVVVCLAVVVKNFNLYVSTDVVSPGVSIYLKEDIQEQPLNMLLSLVRQDERVLEVHLRSKAEAWQLFRNELGVDEYLLDGLSAEDNPLPSSIEVSFKRDRITPALFSSFRDRFAALEGVDLIQYDDLVVGAFSDFVICFRVLVACVAPILCLGACFVIWMALKLGMFAYREELEVKNLLGAGKWSLWSPYIFEGTLLGFLGAVMGLGFVWLCMLIVRASLANRLLLLDVEMVFLDRSGIFLMLLVGLVTGLVGGFLAVRGCLREVLVD